MTAAGDKFAYCTQRLLAAKDVIGAELVDLLCDQGTRTSHVQRRKGLIVMRLGRHASKN